MAITKPIKNRIEALKQEFDALKKGKESLLTLIDEAEIPENVYNSNAIENSTLTLAETEKILLELEVPRNVSLREVYEAKNLARVVEYIRQNIEEKKINKELILFLHKMLINGINDEISGRFRQKNEFVRVGSHIAPAPEHIDLMISSVLREYLNEAAAHFLEKIAKFHLVFEHIHPFIDGNGRIGRILINFQLQKAGYPPIIIRDKEKQDYYQSFARFNSLNKTDAMEKVLSLALTESLYKRIAYLRGGKIIKLSEFAKKSDKTAPAIFNAAKRQNIPAFREKGIWKIEENS